MDMKELSDALLADLRETYKKIETIDAEDEGFKKLTAYFDTLPDGVLVEIKKANIKWASMLARNRLRARCWGKS